MIKKVGGLLVKEVILVMVSILVGVLLLTIVEFIPRERMTGHVIESAYAFHEEGLHPQVWLGMGETSLDNTTDSLMINTTYTKTDDVARDILLGTHMRIPDVHVLNGLYEIMCRGNSDYEIRDYGRYWHGYQVVLCPLLLVFNILEIRQLNTFFQLGLFAVVIHLLYTNRRKGLIIPFIVTYFFLCPVSLFSSLQYSTSLYVMLFTIIALIVSEKSGGGEIHV